MASSNDLHTLHLRPSRPGDADAIVTLNAASEALTGPMDLARWRTLEGFARACLVAEAGGEVVGFVLVLDEHAPYDSENHRWFCERVRRFAYVDRVVVASEWRGRGVGRRLYAEVERFADAEGLAWVAAEVVADPPNVRSLRFHERAGFLEVGRLRVGADKVLSMLLRPLAPPTTPLPPGATGAAPGR